MTTTPERDVHALNLETIAGTQQAVDDLTRTVLKIASERIDGLASELAATKTELAKCRAELKRAEEFIGDMQSGERS